MIEPIVIKVVDKVPIVVSGPQYVVCDNSDYTVVWQLDEEWAQFESRTMQVNYKDGTYERVLFTGNTCALPAFPVSGPVHVGLFAGDIHTTRPARLLAVRSATTDSGEERDSMPNGYAQAIEALDGKLDKNQGAENAGKALVIGDDGNVVPGEAQGGGSLPTISSDTVGKMLTNDGNKAEWADVPREIMYVNFTQEADGKWSADKNWHDAAAVIETGGVVYANPTDRGVYPLTIYDASYYYMTFSVITIMLLEQGFYLVQSTLRWDQDDRVEERNEPSPVLMYAPQTLTAAEQAQARINIGAGTPYTLPIASPTQLGGVKPVAKTDAMTQSIGVDVTGGLYVEPSKVYYIDLEGAYPDYTCPVAMADIKAAYDAGKVLECRCAMGEYTATLPLFIPMPDFNAWIFSGSGALNTPPLNFAAQSLTIAVTSDGVKASNTRLAKMGDIPTVPTALPNPNALTITIGDNVVSYDGSETRVITIPASGGSGGETWELINTFEVAEADAARVIKIDKDSNGNTFSLKEFAFSANTNSTKTDGNVYGWFCVNGKGTYNSGLGGFQTNYVRHPSSGAAIVNDVIGRALPFGLVYDQSTGRKAVEGIVATSVTEVHEVELAGYQSAENLLYGTFSLWGVRK